jgi:UDP-N-acetylmuramoyl-L-alanyl-D-glutamate--2,6-diaminopimelate ligase
VRWHDLLASLDVLERAHDADVEVTSITEDSRRVTPGACFACRAGLVVDGHDHADAARAAGAVALLVERLLPLPIPQARVASVPRVLGRAAATLYRNPSRSMRCLGITGTAGKSTTAALLAAVAHAAGEHTGLIGNDGVFVDGVALEVEKWGGTNMPQADQLQMLLAGMRDRGVQTVAREVTSRALDFGRVDATWFAAACFTNLSHEHLDDHGSMEAYFAAKRSLFEPERVGVVATNIDDAYGVRIGDHARAAGLDVWTYATGADGAGRADIVADDVVLGARGVSLTVVDRRSENRVRVDAPLIGRFNIGNVLAAAATARAVGFGLDAAAEGARSTRVRGRAERIDDGQPFTVLVDYAHAPGELDAVLGAARDLAGDGGKVVLVFGCGGGRDPSKRPLMGAAAARGADVVVLTSDNPRHEDPQAIADAVLPALGSGSPEVTVELDRRVAVRIALGAAGPGDVVVIAGKGPETGQTIGGRTLPFDDAVVAREELGALGWS